MASPMTFDVVATRRLNAEPSQVFWFWEDPVRMRMWWGPTGFTCPIAEMDFRIGGSSLIAMRSPEEFGSAEMYTTWQYTNIVRNHSIDFVMDFTDADARRLPDGDVRIPPGVGQGVKHFISFNAIDESTTEMTVIEKTYMSKGARDVSAIGLDQCLDKLEAALSTVTTGETVAARYRRRADLFEQKLMAVNSHGWDAPSPCAKWNARDVVKHVVDMHGAMLTPIGKSLGRASTLDDDPIDAFRSARLDVEQVLENPEAAQMECRTPAGTMTAQRQIDEVVSDDLVFHGWDLAKATAQDARLDDVDVARLWALIEGVPDEVMIRYRTPDAFGPGIEVYGPEVAVSSAASPQERLLGFVGRDPNWQRPT